MAENTKQSGQPTDSAAVGPSEIVGALPMPVILVGAQGEMSYVNPAAEQFFDMGAGLLSKHKLADLLPFGSPLLQLVNQS
ncbi:MAG: hypothetical protein V3S07_10075, partial [Micropepsaceae bacterium]